MNIALITDGQTDIDSRRRSDAPESRSSRSAASQASQAFKGTVTIDAAAGTITRANGSDLGSFIDEGFQKGMRIRLSGTPAPTATTWSPTSTIGT